MLSIRSLLRKKEKERQIMRFVRNKRTKNFAFAVMPSAAGAAERGACMMAAFATIVREPALSRKRMDE